MSNNLRKELEEQLSLAETPEEREEIGKILVRLKASKSPPSPPKEAPEDPEDSISIEDDTDKEEDLDFREDEEPDDMEEDEREDTEIDPRRKLIKEKLAEIRKIINDDDYEDDCEVISLIYERKLPEECSICRDMLDPSRKTHHYIYVGAICDECYKIWKEEAKKEEKQYIDDYSEEGISLIIEEEFIPEQDEEKE